MDTAVYRVKTYTEKYFTHFAVILAEWLFKQEPMGHITHQKNIPWIKYESLSNIVKLTEILIYSMQDLTINLTIEQ